MYITITSGANTASSLLSQIEGGSVIYLYKNVVFIRCNIINMKIRYQTTRQKKHNYLNIFIILYSAVTCQFRVRASGAFIN